MTRLVLLFLLIPSLLYAGTAGIIWTDTDCTQAKYLVDGAMCQDTDTNDKLYIGTGTAVREIQYGISGSKTLTDNSATDIFTVAMDSNSAIGGIVNYNVTATDGTDYQDHAGVVSFACVNKAGTVTKDIDEIYLAASETEIVSAGSISDDWAMKAGDVCTVTLDVDSSLGTPTDILYYEIKIFGNNAVTLH